LKHLDLDTLAWIPTVPPRRKALADSKQEIDAFLRSSASWVIEGCYADLIEMALPQATEIIFMDLPVDACIANARQRPWEPHKYESKKAQDDNLNMLIDWISRYAEREDTFSRSAHVGLFESFSGKKTRYTRPGQARLKLD
jgi:hypothetical protein